MADPITASTPTLYMRGTDGKVVIYTGNPNVVSNPANGYSRVMFHSDLTYPKIVDVRTGSITLPAYAANTGNYSNPVREATHQLFAHGQAGQPLVQGRILGGSSQDIPLTGSVPLQADQYGFARWVHLGADSTHVLLHEHGLSYVGSSKGPNTINYEIYVSDFLL